MPKIKELLIRSDTRREKNTKKNFFDTPTEKSCHHCPKLVLETQILLTVLNFLFRFFLVLYKHD